MQNAVRISPAREAQLPLILEFIRKLAEYEKLLDEVVADEETLRESLFGPDSPAKVIFAYVEEQPVGFAVYFHNFSTFAGRAGIYLEDLFVEPAFRGRGIGMALLAYIARVAKERGCARLNWAVLDWNQPAIDFYRRLGAVALEDWTVFRLSGEALDRLAARQTL
jgi:GNAT superfamily N-acetyltransferase